MKLFYFAAFLLPLNVAHATDNFAKPANNEAQTQLAAPCPAPYEERNGLVVIEAENLPVPAGWQKKTNAGGYTGSGYIEWVNSPSLSTPGVGLIEIPVNITKTGKYYFRWRSKVGKGTSSTDHNDTWLKFPNASNFYGEGGRIAYPHGSGRTPNPNGAGSGGWFKVFSSGTTDWTWSTNTSDHENLQIVAEFNTPGVYKIQVSARSDGHLLDRLVLHHSSVSTTTAFALGNPETKCSADNTTQQSVVSCTLMNADTDQPIKEIAQGEELNLATLPTRNLNIRVNTDPTIVGSVVMELTGAQTRKQSETAAPYALFGNNGADYLSWTPAEGFYALTSTPYTGAGGSGTAGRSLILKFSVVNRSVNNPVAVHRINAGGGSFTASDGKVFGADNFAGGGNSFAQNNSTDIGNTTNDALYRTERWGNFSYNLPVSNGQYTVVLHFAEVYWTSAGQRKFNVDMEGQRKLTEYDIFAKAGGAYKAVQETFTVSVGDGTLNVSFGQGSADNAKVSAIEVIANTAGARLANAETSELSPLITYPNPATDQVTIQGVDPQCDDFKLSITNGISVRYPKYVESSPSSVQVMLDGLDTGIYLLHVRQRGKVQVQKVLIKR